MNTRTGLLVLLLVVSGCPRRAPPRVPPMLMPHYMVGLSEGPSSLEWICGERPMRRRGEPERLERTCWQRSDRYYCKGCSEERDLSCFLELPGSIKAGETIPLKVQLHNLSQTAFRVEPSSLPWSGLFSYKAFHMRCDGEPVPWPGSVREAHGEGGHYPREYNTYVSIPPGGTIEGTVDLGHVFRWAEGSCMVQWNGVLWDVIAGDQLPPPGTSDHSVEIKCNWAATHIER